MNIAPVTAGALPAAHDVPGRQPDMPAAATRQTAGQVAAVAPETQVNKADTVPEETNPEQLKQRVAELNELMKQHASSVLFSIDEESGRTIVKVIDTDTDNVLRQYPTKELLAISKQIDKFQGMFIKTQA